MSEPQGRRVALFIANDTFYSRSLSRLCAPVSDARALRNLLHAPERGGFESADILVNESKMIHQDHPALEETIATLAATGARYGIHVLVTLPPWTQFALPAAVDTRIELRLGDPADSRLDRDAAGQVPPNRPGRGLAPDKRHLLVALPTADSGTQRPAAGVAAAVRRIRAEYGARQAPRVPVLPRTVHRAEVDRAARAAGLVQDSTHVVIGLGERELSPLTIDFARHPHLLAFGDTGFGKTTLLHTILLGLLENATSEQIGILLVDPRGALVQTVRDRSAVVAAPSIDDLPARIDELGRGLRKRGEKSDSAGRAARDRGTRPDLYVIVDDYDAVVTDDVDPLGPLEEFLPMSRDIGLHLVLARRATGLEKALEGGVLGCLNKLSTPTLTMRASTEESAALTGDLSAEALAPGRGILRTRSREPELVQISYSP